eukprot:CAMPEP_0170618728 /NCGR_PEP_ID=MMETSP0224-20130122/27113_1 /TAXON_ID=285029 /ORGANISM="Togula jolla, Strain CCCM 725" /LENGTH=522 /DNA_ID=CAMNT_0010944721 /DNA_START=104 /DNA_END=1672 /DNA_ORIENTATION=-
MGMTTFPRDAESAQAEATALLEMPTIGINYGPPGALPDRHLADLFRVSRDERLRSPSRPGLIIVPEKGADKSSHQELALTAVEEWGMVAMVINYNSANDVTIAVKYLRLNAEDYGVDPNRIALLGYKKGGFKALKAALRGQKKKSVQATIIVEGSEDDELVPLVHEGASPALFLQNDKIKSATAKALIDVGVDVKISSKAKTSGAKGVMAKFLKNYLGRDSESPFTETSTTQESTTAATTSTTTSAPSLPGYGCKPCSGNSGNDCDYVDGELRLTEREGDAVGTLRIYQDGKWHAICDYDEFDEQFESAAVACRQLGFSDENAWWLNYDQAATYEAPLWLPQYKCNGTEDKLTDCPVEREDTFCLTRWTARVVCNGGCPNSETTTTTPPNLCTGGGDVVPMTCGEVAQVDLWGVGKSVPEWESPDCYGEGFKNWFSVAGNGRRITVTTCGAEASTVLSLASCDGDELVEQECNYMLYYECGVYGSEITFRSTRDKTYLVGVGSFDGYGFSDYGRFEDFRVIC